MAPFKFMSRCELHIISYTPKASLVVRHGHNTAGRSCRAAGLKPKPLWGLP